MFKIIFCDISKLFDDNRRKQLQYFDFHENCTITSIPAYFLSSTGILSFTITKFITSFDPSAFEFTLSIQEFKVQDVD